MLRTEEQLSFVFFGKVKNIWASDRFYWFLKKTYIFELENILIDNSDDNNIFGYNKLTKPTNQKKKVSVVNILSKFDCCDWTEGVCMYVCVCVCVGRS